MELCGVDTVLSDAVNGGLCDIDRASGGGDTAVNDVDTVVSGAISGGLCDLDRVSEGGDTGVSGVATVVPGAVIVCLCDLDSVSPGDIVVRVGELSLSGDGDAVVLGVDEPICGVSSVMTAGDLDVCGCGSLVSEETGDVVSVDDVVACGYDPLLPGAVCFGDRLSVFGNTLVCDSGVVEKKLRWWLYQELLNLFG